MEIWKLFIGSFKKDYSEGWDYKKLSVFALVLSVVYVNVHSMIDKGITDALVNLDIWTIGLLVGSHVAPMMTKSGADIKAKEMDIQTNAETTNK